MIDRDDLQALRAAQHQLDKELIRRQRIMKNLRQADDRVRQARVHAQQLQDAIQTALNFQSEGYTAASPLDAPGDHP